MISDQYGRTKNSTLLFELSTMGSKVEAGLRKE